MGFLHSRIKHVVDAYHVTVEKIREIEDEAAISAVNYRYAENTKHLIEALILALEYGISDNQAKSEEYFTKVLNRLELWLGDACQHVAGTKLKDTADKILGSLLNDRKQAQALYDKARHFWTRGRNNRKSDTIDSANYFVKSVKNCNKALLTIKPITKVQWITILISLISIIAALSGWFAYFFK